MKLQITLDEIMGARLRKARRSLRFRSRDGKLVHPTMTAMLRLGLQLIIRAIARGDDLTAVDPLSGKLCIQDLPHGFITTPPVSEQAYEDCDPAELYAEHRRLMERDRLLLAPGMHARMRGRKFSSRETPALLERVLRVESIFRNVVTVRRTSGGAPVKVHAFDLVPAAAQRRATTETCHRLELALADLAEAIRSSVGPRLTVEVGDGNVPRWEDVLDLDTMAAIDEFAPNPRLARKEVGG